MAYTEKYVSVAGAGAHDGDAEGSAWTLAEMLTNLAAGERGNMISGAYSSGADVMTNAGTVTQLICVRGYNSAIGDLDTQGRDSDTPLDVTNFPVITVTGIIAPSAYNLWQNIHITGAVATYNFGSTSVDNYAFMSCKFTQTGTGLALLMDNNCTLINCDAEATASNHGNILSGDNNIVLIGCRIEGAATSGTPRLATFVNAAVINCAFLGTSSCVGVYVEQSSLLWAIVNNTFYACGTAIQTPNAAISVMVPIVNNHVTDCAEYLDNLYSGTANHIVLEAYNRTRDNTTPRTGISAESLLVGEVTTDTGGAETDYVNAPAGDITLIPTAPAIDAGMGM